MNQAQTPDMSKKEHIDETCAKEGENVTLPEDVRKTLRNQLGTLINRFNRESDYAPIVNFFLARQSTAKTEGIEIGRKQKSNSGRLQYQDGYKAGRVKGYTDSTRDHLGTEADWFNKGVKTAKREVFPPLIGQLNRITAMNQRVFGENGKVGIEYHALVDRINGIIHDIQVDIDSTTDQLLNPQTSGQSNIHPEKGA